MGAFRRRATDTEDDRQNRRAADEVTLTEFLLARIAEDEAVAQAAVGEPVYPPGAYGDNAADEFIFMAQNEGCSELAGEHFRRWMPERVLAECEAKRRIVAACPIKRMYRISHESPALPEVLFVRDEPRGRWADSGEPLTDGQVDYLNSMAVDEVPPVLKMLAQPYRDHPDCQQEWAVS
jgi:hypothetical protein